MLKIKLNVNTNRQEKLFYFLLPLYKSFIFKLFKFNINTKNKDIKLIEKALNIKSRKKRIYFVFCAACNQIDEFMSEYKNPCGFKNNKCYAQKCTKKINGCCRYCKYQSVNGCTTRNLACKLFYCSEVTKRHKVLTIDDLKILKVLNKGQRTILRHDYFSSEKEILRDIYLGIIITPVLIMFIRTIINLIKIKYKNRAMI